jgi:hypothetical protein
VENNFPLGKKDLWTCTLLVEMLGRSSEGYFLDIEMQSCHPSGELPATRNGYDVKTVDATRD